jgi:vacuolar-type H+-ATPase subunit E/Vma4
MTTKSALELKILEKAKSAAADIVRKEAESSKALLEEVRLRGQKVQSEAMAQAKGRAKMVHKEYEASAHLEAKLLLLKKKEEMISGVMAKALEGLKVRTRRDDYRDVAAKLIGEAVVSLGIVDVHVTLGKSERDVLGSDLSEIAKAISAKIGRKVQLTLLGEALNSLGGVRIADKGQHLIYDNSWDTRLERMKQDLGVEISDILYSTKRGTSESKARAVQTGTPN